MTAQHAASGGPPDTPGEPVQRTGGRAIAQPQPLGHRAEARESSPGHRRDTRRERFPQHINIAALL